MITSRGLYAIVNVHHGEICFSEIVLVLKD
jgi:hypothetical protein